MDRIKFTIVIAAVTATLILVTQKTWQVIHPAVPPRAGQKPSHPLDAPTAGDAQQAARDFFTALKNSDWNTAKKFWPTGPGMNKTFDDVFTDRTKNVVAGLEIVSIGTPYKESGNRWTMIPYEVQFKGGGSQTNSLRMMKQSDGQWVWGGGF